MKRHMLLVACILCLGGCTNLVSGITSQMADDLAVSILNSKDVDTVREAIPAYLVLIDSFLRRSPDDVDLLMAAAALNGSFSTLVGPERARLLSGKSLTYAHHAACMHDRQLCDLDAVTFEAFENRMSQLSARDVEVTYALGVAWAGWIQAHSDDWNAIGKLGRVKSVMERVIELDETWDNGGAHLYLGVLETLFPAALGGRPEKGRGHFDRALSLSSGRYLMTRVMYAQQYARLIYDRELHDRLLTEVIEADPVADGMTLTNRLAQQRARELLTESDDYF